MRDFATQRLINARKQLDRLVVEAGRILSRYVQPDSISNETPLISNFIFLMVPHSRQLRKPGGRQLSGADSVSRWAN
jgi:hypothetical protein